MYRVKGSDNNVYGPVSGETIRQWIAERRLNAVSQVSREGEDVWQPLGQIAEFAELLGAQAAPQPASPTGAGFEAAPIGDVHGGYREMAQAAIKPAAICLIVYGWICVGFSALGIVLQIAAALVPGLRERQAQQIRELVLQIFPNLPPATFESSITSDIIKAVLGMALSVVILMAGYRLKRLRSFGLVMTGTVLAMLPCSTCCCLGLPLGIWILVLTSRHEIKSQFE